MVQKVLVVDDDEDIHEIVYDILTSMEYEVLKALDGKEAVQLAKANPPDLIFLDLMMPHMDGFEVLFKLRRDMLTRFIPVVVMSAHYSKSDSGRLPGVKEIISKSNLSREIMRVVAELG